jgi:hypothetical protein
MTADYRGTRPLILQLDATTVEGLTALLAPLRAHLPDGVTLVTTSYIQTPDAYSAQFAVQCGPQDVGA